jgi:hypothetical protein
MSTAGDDTSGASGTAVQQAAGLLGSEVREGYAEIGDVRLHYVEAGEGRGQDDRYLGQDLAEPYHDDVPGLDRVERLPGAPHWVHHDKHERVNQLLIDFFAPALPAKNPAR